MKILCILLFVFLGLCLIDTFRSFLLYRKGIKLVEKSEAYTQKGNGMRILVLGDSTAVGTGVEDKKDSTAGRLGAKYSDAEIMNFAENGMRLKGLKTIVDSIRNGDHFDLVLVQIGANDVIRFTKMKEIENDIRHILRELAKVSDKVVVLHSGNIGEAKFFPFYVRGILSKRSKEVKDIYTKVASETGALYVNLIDSPIAKFLKEEPEKYYASDFLHLSGEGYGLWFEEIQKKL